MTRVTHLLAGSALATVLAMPAWAAETTAGTDVENQASVTYTVGGTTTTTQSNIATFKVDKKVNLVVAEVGGAPTYVALGSNDQVTTFTVTNLTNDVQDFRLNPDQQNVSIPLLGADDFDMNNLRAFVDTDGDGEYDPLIDTRTFVDELVPDGTVKVFVVGNVPNTPGISTAIVSLNAIAAEGGSTGVLGQDVVATSTLVPESSTSVDIVFADDGGLLDGLRNGQSRAFDSYRIGTAAVTLAKTSRVISDPVNLLVNPRRIPGAVVEYCLRIDNAGPGRATALTVTDNIPANTTYVPESIVVGGIGSGGLCTLGGTSEDDNDTGGDETDLYGGSFDGTTVRATLPEVDTLVPLAVSFRVTVR